MKLTFTVPVKATFTLNSRAHWRVRQRQRKGERNAVVLAWRSRWTTEAGDRTMSALVPRTRKRGATITLTRIGPRKLDDDNVQGALKAIRDEVAAQLGIDDGDARLTWRYGQERGEYAVRVEIEVSAAEVAA